MKDLTYTVREASDILRKPVATVREWAHLGFFQTTGAGKNLRLNRADVVKVREDLNNGRQLESQSPREYVAEIQLRLSRLERMVAAVCRAQGIDSGGDLSDISDGDLYRVYTNAITDLARTRWEYLETRQWVSTFLRISESDFERLSATTDNARPWIPFVDLAGNIKSWWRQQALTPETMEISYLLTRAVENLRKAVLVYSAKADKSPEYLFSKYLEAPPINRLIRFAFKKG